jgi:hypothetical protein
VFGVGDKTLPQPITFTVTRSPITQTPALLAKVREICMKQAQERDECRPEKERQSSMGGSTTQKTITGASCIG